MKCTKCQTEIVGMARFCPKCGAPVQMQLGQTQDLQAMERIRQHEPFFGAWKIVRQIGKGGFSHVYEIERDEFGKTYKAAMKVISIPQDESEIQDLYADGMDTGSISTYYQGCIKDITGEFDLMAHMKGNSNIVSYEDHMIIPHSNNIGADILIRMELLSPLTKYLETHRITKKDVALIAIDICKALEICEKYNIVHRDLKPENIFVSDLGNYKLGDFGIARTVEKTQTIMTKKGTLNYMSPEIYRGEQSDATVDIYSLGLVMYRLCNRNRLPFLPPAPQPLSHEDKDNAMLRRMNGEQMTPPVDADDTLTAIIFKACAYHATDRYATAKEMRKALEDYVDTLPEDVVGSADDMEDVTTQLDLESTTATNTAAVSANFTAPSGNFTSPSANFTAPSGNFTSPSGNYATTAGSATSTTGTFAAQPQNFSGTVGGVNATPVQPVQMTPTYGTAGQNNGYINPNGGYTGPNSSYTNPNGGYTAATANPQTSQPAKKKKPVGLIVLLIVAIVVVVGVLIYAMSKLSDSSATTTEDATAEEQTFEHKTAKKRDTTTEDASDTDTTDDTATADTSEAAAEDDTDEPTGTEIFADATNYNIGYYYSSYFNITGRVATSDWSLETRDVLVSESGLSYTETDEDAIRNLMLEDLKNGTSIYDLFAISNDQKKACAVTMMYNDTGKTEEEYAQGIVEQIESDEDYTDATASYEAYNIAGADHVKIESSFVDEGVQNYLDYVIVVKGNYIFVLYVDTEDTDETDEIVSLFY